jgi:hypothetical protein
MEMMKVPRRVKTLEVSAEMIACMSQGIFKVTETDIPADARVVGVMTAHNRLSVNVLIEHESFEELHDGALTPYLGGPRIVRMVEIDPEIVTVEDPRTRRRIQLRED